jgi:hypothetical protein
MEWSWVIQGGHRSAADAPRGGPLEAQVAVEGWRIESKHRPIP